MGLTDFQIMLKGYSLTTANILYHMPDHPNLLQDFTWQTYDIAPHFPEIKKFLAFWEEKIEGRLHSVKLAHKKLISPGEWTMVNTEFALH
jgi:uncharacterized protein Usg